MTTWATFLSELRTELVDPVPATGSPRYSDDLLFIYTRDGIRDYSQFFPRSIHQEQLEAAINVARAYVLPMDLLGIEDVQCPLDTHMELSTERPGSQVSISKRLLFYYIVGNYLYLNYDPKEGDGVFLSYYALHPVPDSKDDCDFEITISNADIELIKLFVQAKVQIKVRNDQSRLDRFKVTAGSREDNPMIIEADDYMDRYHEGIVRRMRGGRIQLYRPRKYVRSSVIQKYQY